MPEPIEFGSFYQLLHSVKEGSEEQVKELQWMLAEYEHAKESKGAFDELGQVFCHIGVMELYTYTGIEDLSYISGMEPIIWDYLRKREGSTAKDALVSSMVKHSKEHYLPDKIATKWEFDKNDLSENVNNLASYIAEGIVDIVIN